MNPQVLEVVLRVIHEVNQKTLSEAKLEAREEMMIEVAKAFKNQADINFVSAFTGLSIEEINCL